MKSSLFKSRPSLAAGALLLVALVLAGCYNPQATPVGGYPAAQTGAAQSQPYNTNMGPPVMPRVPEPAAANAAGPRLHVSDLITIEWFDTVNPIPQYRERIREDGKLILPLNVTVQAAGRSVAELQDDIRSAYVPKYYNHLTVSVKTEERVYFVGGEVRVPNRQLYQDGVTVLRAIDTAGGFTDFAKRSNIELRRENGQIIKVNWDKAMKDPKLDPTVHPNDQIIVHKRLF
jgi:protein involved in polysaccharide export with SLBB domain